MSKGITRFFSEYKSPIDMLSKYSVSLGITFKNTGTDGMHEISYIDLAPEHKQLLMVKASDIGRIDWSPKNEN